MVLECYQTLEDRGNIEEVEKYGPFLCSRSDVWLGEGYYFWDSDIVWAHSWGNGPVFATNGYIICQASIQYDELIFDLFGNVKHQTAFKKIYDILKKRVPPNDEILVRDVILALQKTGSFPFTGIRAADEPRSTLSVKFNKGRKEQLIINQRVQICLLNKNNLLSQTFRIVFPEKYVI